MSIAWGSEHALFLKKIKVLFSSNTDTQSFNNFFHFLKTL
ncbi:hypothetical protein HMPREF1395_00549 [Helicobacter pylori GAM112Ai]|nr:hypothetical protein HMPREF1395_00549 [Helicobacter pylori GAM112Ai]EMH32753.1 hypothetical protein HMPREF1424_00898 [Helicobacter pylori GAM42Ai]